MTVCGLSGQACAALLVLLHLHSPARRNSACLDRPGLPTPGTSYTEPALGGVILCANTFLVERLCICLEFERENGKAGRTLEIW